jgi:cytochrome c-type biogenesis protein CcmH/NrfG
MIYSRHEARQARLTGEREKKRISGWWLLAILVATIIVALGAYGPHTHLLP